MNPASRTATRYATKDVKLGDIHIKKGTLVHVPLVLNTLGKGLKNEGDFIPERWLNGEIDKLDTFFKVQFGSGPKNCIG